MKKVSTPALDQAVREVTTPRVRRVLRDVYDLLGPERAQLGYTGERLTEIAARYQQLVEESRPKRFTTDRK